MKANKTFCKINTPMKERADSSRAGHKFLLENNGLSSNVSSKIDKYEGNIVAGQRARCAKGEANSLKITQNRLLLPGRQSH